MRDVPARQSLEPLAVVALPGGAANSGDTFAGQGGASGPAGRASTPAATV